MRLMSSLAAMICLLIMPLQSLALSLPEGREAFESLSEKEKCGFVSFLSEMLDAGTPVEFSQYNELIAVRADCDRESIELTIRARVDTSKMTPNFWIGMSRDMDQHNCGDMGFTGIFGWTTEITQISQSDEVLNVITTTPDDCE